MQTDASMGVKKEASYGVAETVNRWYEFVDQSFVQDNKYVQGKGLRVGRYTDRRSRRALAMVDAKGTLKLEAATVGMGPIWEAMLGTNTSSLRSGVIYQQLATPKADPAPSYTWQAGIPPIGGGATVAQTYSGMVCDKWEISCDASSAIVMVSTDWIGKKGETGIGYTAPSYATAPNLFTFTQGAIAIGNNTGTTLTVPTTTTLGTTTATADYTITKFSLKGDNGASADPGGYVLGSAGQRNRVSAYGLRKWTGSFTAEFQDVSKCDWYLNQTSLNLLLTFTSATAITGGAFATLQIAIPCLVLEGDVPVSNGGKVVETDFKFTVLDAEVAAYPLYIAQVTADTAL